MTTTSKLASLNSAQCHACMSTAAQAKNNKILDTYHSGAYGSLQPDEWSCCQRKGREQMGCRISIKPIADSMEERLRERRLSPAELIPRRRGGIRHCKN